MATDFPRKGDDQKVSLRNSQWQLFPLAYAEDLKENYPSIWRRGGNIRGNDQFRKLAPVARRGGSVESESEENDRLAGVVAQIKWLAVGSRGLSHMKQVINEAKQRVRDNRCLTCGRRLTRPEQ
jgi:hypothetical protein